MGSSKLSPVQRFLFFLKPDRKEIRNIYVYAFFNGLVNLSLPVGIQSIINLIQGGSMSTSWVLLVVFVIVGIAVSGVLQIHQLKITEHLQQKIFTRSAFDFSFRVPKFKLEALFGKNVTELMNRFFDVLTLQKGLSKILIDFSTASIQTLFGLILLSLYHPFFIMYSIILLFFVYVLFKFTSKKGLETSLKESSNKYLVANWLEELARTNISFKLAGDSELPMLKVNDYTNAYIDARESHFKVLKNQYILLVVFKVLIAAGLLIVGSLLVINQQMNIGQFVAAEIIILLVLASVEKLIMSIETIYDVLTSIEKIGQVTDIELDDEDGLVIECDKGLSVELKDVSFSYPSQDKNILKNVSLKIESGERLLVTGENNSGKSTLLYLLASLYKINKGELMFNNLPVGNYNPSTLRLITGDSFLDDHIFDGTLLENITLGRAEATFENVMWAIENLHLSDVVQSLDKGLNTPLNASNKKFSKSTLNKLFLARSIVHKPRLLLINDVFVTLNKDERESIIDFIASKSQPWTLILASRDESLASKVDKTVVFVKDSLKEIN